MLDVQPPARSARTHKVFSALLLIALLAMAGTSASAASSYFVRTDGGSPTQCNGRSDAAYPGSGNNQACAWKHPFDALPPMGAARIAGGDTLTIGRGSYKMGYNPPATDLYGAICQGSNSFDCVMQRVPSGPSKSQPTRIVGASCSAPPELWGSQAAYSIFNLQGSSNVEIGCLELTDHAQCIRNAGGEAGAIRCNTSAYPPNQDWAWMAINAADSANVTLVDLNIHGFAMWGIQAARLTDWTLQRVKINGNGWAGWEGDLDQDGTGRGSSNRGTIGFIDVEIAWNGCAERYPNVGQYAWCWGQEQGGYGDGLGAGRTGGHWVFEGGHIHHNASDGLDLLYADGSGSVTVSGLRADSNAGNQVKASGPMTVENSVLVGSCAALAGSGLRKGELCRAMGNTLSLSPINNARVDVRYNTITGQGDCLVISHLGSSNSRIEMRNNALIGGVNWPAQQYGESKNSCLYYWEPPSSSEPSNGTPQVGYVNNLIWQVKGNTCPGGGNLCQTDPKIGQAGLTGFDPKPRAGSPLIDAGAPPHDVAIDVFGTPRPQGRGYEIGAVEVASEGGGTPPPSCVRAAPRLAISSAPAAVAAGTTLRYDLTLTNNDSAACEAATFDLGKTAPSGWSSTLAAVTLHVAPGGSARTSIDVTSPRTAGAGTYAFDVSASNGALRATARGNYAVATAPPPPTCARVAPLLSLSGPTAAVGAGTQLSFQVALTSRDSASCSTVKFNLGSSLPKGFSGSFGATSLSPAPGATASTTIALTSPLSVWSAPGAYAFSVTASGASPTATAKSTYTVIAPRMMLSTSKETYRRGETLVATSKMRSEGQPIPSANVRLTLTRPDGSTTRLTVATDRNGNADFRIVLNSSRYPKGRYRLHADGSAGTATVTDTASFSIQ